MWMDNRVGYLLVPTFAVPAPVPVFSIPTYPISPYPMITTPIIMQPPGFVQFVDNSFNNIWSWHITAENEYYPELNHVVESDVPLPMDQNILIKEEENWNQHEEILNVKYDESRNISPDDVKTQTAKQCEETKSKQDTVNEAKELEKDKIIYQEESLSYSYQEDSYEEEKPISGKNHQSRQIRWKKINDK